MKPLSFAFALLGMFAVSQLGFGVDVIVPPPVEESEEELAPPIADPLTPPVIRGGVLPPPRASGGVIPPSTDVPPSGVGPRATSPYAPGLPRRYYPPSRRGNGSATNSRSASSRPSPPIPTKPGETKFSLTLKDGTRLIGKPVGLAQIPVGTSFGEARIPLRVVRSLESIPNGTDVKIHFRNGDVVSATVRGDTMTFATTYGEIKIPLADVVTMRLGTSFANPTAPRSPVPSRPVVVRPRSGRYPRPSGGGFAPAEDLPASVPGSAPAVRPDSSDPFEG